MAVETNSPHNLKALFLEQVLTAWKRKWLALAVAWTVCLMGWAGVMLVPQRYESNARVYVDVNGLLAPLLKGLVVDTTPEQSEQYLRQTLLSRPNLEQVILLADLGRAPMTNIRRQELVSGLASDIKVTTESNNLISIGYTNRDPFVAKRVLDALLSIFAEKADSSSRAEMDKARAFLTSQIKDYEDQLQAAEQRRADFKKKFSKYFNDAGVAQPQTLKQQATQASEQYEEAIASRNALQAQMGQVPQLLDVVASAPTVSNTGQIVVGSPEVRLSQAEHNLADLKLQYTNNHPDVIAAERSVKDLKAELAAENARGGSREGKTQISNPAYEQLRLKLVDAQAMLPVLKQRLDKATQDYENAKALSAELPEVAAKSQRLDRDYDIIKLNYDELLKRREAANLSQAANDRTDRTEFRTIDPPQVPIFPSFPNRLELYSLVLILGFAMGAAAPLALAKIRPTFGSAESLRNMGLPVIGVITYAPTAKPVGKNHALAAALYPAAVAGLLLFYSGIVLVTSGIYREMM